MPLPDRKLAAILSVDVVGYSGLTGKNERRTLAALRELRNETFEPASQAKKVSLIKAGLLE